jgi:hypothetical protein
LFLEGYSPAQLAEFKAVIYNNIVIGLQTLLIKFKNEGEFSKLSPDVQKAADVCISLQVIVDLETMRKLISTIWSDPLIKQSANLLEPSVI